MRRIDLHTHVFNVRYLPIARILHQRGGLPKPIARGIAKLLNWRTGDQIGQPAQGPQDLVLEAVESTAAVEPAVALARATLAALIDDPDVRDALAMISKGSPKAILHATANHFDDASAQLQFERLYAQVEVAGRDSIFSHSYRRGTPPPHRPVERCRQLSH